ncbi:MAG: DnaJ domain-containing protein [Elusimicrobia bacterium]|nr:DnaJ domain-containing protein [Elusimicrobiota bacterium]
MKYWFYLIAILYALSPIDLVPEWFAGHLRFGLIDDIVVIGALYWYFIYRPARLSACRRTSDDSGGRGQREEESRENGQRSQEMDPYEVLGVAKGASLDEIKHAYRELANKYHPDKVSHLGDEFKEIANKRFKEIWGAYQELTQK